MNASCHGTDSIVTVSLRSSTLRGPYQGKFGVSIPFRGGMKLEVSTYIPGSLPGKNPVLVPKV